MSVTFTRIGKHLLIDGFGDDDVEIVCDEGGQEGWANLSEQEARALHGWLSEWLEGKGSGNE